MNIDCIRKRIIIGILLSACALVSLNCKVASGNEEFFGKTTPPEGNILRYVNGPEPESFDPAVSSGQGEARIYMALFEGLVEYNPKSLDAIPAIAERWDTNQGFIGVCFPSAPQRALVKRRSHQCA